ncbi:hypothetical protein QE152_g33825 [Popillia japonica]|uniref:Uncharacterized protein n=1 Tax=Popillia japonica TaxID=7064 RepID=A0AAW1IVL4_POPJA
MLTAIYGDGGISGGGIVARSTPLECGRVTGQEVVSELPGWGAGCARRGGVCTAEQCCRRRAADSARCLRDDSPPPHSGCSLPALPRRTPRSSRGPRNRGQG